MREGEVAAGDRCAVAEPGQRNEGHPWQARRGSPSRVMNGRVALVALSGAVFFWILFVAVLGIPHPPGIWPSLF